VVWSDFPRAATHRAKLPQPPSPLRLADTRRQWLARRWGRGRRRRGRGRWRWRRPAAKRCHHRSGQRSTHTTGPGGGSPYAARAYRCEGCTGTVRARVLAGLPVGARVSGRGRVGGGNDGVAVRGEISHRFVSGRDGTIQPRPQKSLNHAASVSGSQTSRNRSRRPTTPVAVKVAGFALMRARCTRPRPLQGRLRQHRPPPKPPPHRARHPTHVLARHSSVRVVSQKNLPNRGPAAVAPTRWAPSAISAPRDSVGRPSQKQAQSSPPGRWRAVSEAFSLARYVPPEDFFL